MPQGNEVLSLSSTSPIRSWRGAMLSSMNEAIMVIFTGKSLSRAYLKRGKPFIFSPQDKSVCADNFCNGICFGMDIKLLERNGFMSKRLLQVSVIALIGAFYAMPISYYTTKILRICGILPG
jgi:CRP-like cAMP-binding protein